MEIVQYERSQRKNILGEPRVSTKKSIDPVTKISQVYSSPFSVLISCILSLRTKDEVTYPASVRILKLANNPWQMLKLSLDRIRREIYPVGFYRTKAKTIKNLFHELVRRFNGGVPKDMDDLLSLNGVGRKTANLVLTLGFGMPGICVDTHVHRISNRLGFVKTNKPYDTEIALRKVLPKKFWIEYNNLFVAFGKNICKPISPLCSKCKLGLYCPKINVTRRR